MRKLMATELGPAGGYLVLPEVDMGGRRIVMLAASHDTQAALAAWAQAQGFDLSQTWGGREIDPGMFDFHVTLLATANDVFIPEGDHLIEPVEVEPVGFDVLGQDADTPVLRIQDIDAPAADAGASLGLMRTYFIDTYGAEPTFADFKPHVSLSYAWTGEPALEDDLPLPDFPLLFDRLIVKPFDPAPAGKGCELARIIAALEAAPDLLKTDPWRD